MTSLQIQEALNLHKLYLKSAKNGARANFRGANLEGASLGGANLEGASLEGANLLGANLWGASLWGANLEGANLEGANLGGANLFRGANLGGAYLYDASLGGANLEGANLEGANLGGANLEGANSSSLIYAMVGWSDHGECGRTLRAYSKKPFDEVIYSCGCFSGNTKELYAYIDNGTAEWSKSRLLAANFVEARINEMIEERKNK